MNRTELVKILADFGIHPSKAKGQNFLVDRNMLAAMVATMNLTPQEQILEVGPGTGVLTRMILEAGCNLTSIETDKKLFDYLQANIQSTQFNLVFGDACRINYSQVLKENEPFRCIANLPYAISSVFISKMIELPTPPTEMFFLLQKEMAERFSAAPHSKKYGSLTVRAGALYNAKILRNVPPQVFHPQPKVDSAFIQLKLKTQLPASATLLHLNKLSKVAFSQRRKKAFKLICTQFDESIVSQAYERLNLSKDIRAEDITIPQYIAFATFLSQQVKT